jgi:hypothetical protein
MATVPHPFALGWSPQRAAIVRSEMLAQGQYCRVLPGATPPPAFSLSDKRRRHLEQKQAGTCWAHSGTQNCEVSANSLGYDSFDVCRRLVGWQGKQFEGGGNPSDGGTSTDALRAMTTQGAGIAHESLCPYTDNYRTLGTKPSQNVFDDAIKSHLVGIVDVTSDDDARRLIASGRPVSNGIWWPYGWDSSQTFMITIGSGTYGHALLEIGYVTPGVWDEYAWFQFDNWHGLLYPPLPADRAAKVPGYQPIRADRTSDFWVRADVYERVRNYGNAERVAATDLDGLGKIVSIPDLIDAFIV